ncbi:MAG: TrmH family RNA methyltransferase [Thermoanaerobaculales bacterium]|jgi:tRNA/rRNA methyltransferase|nr:TrmH family RNA methyltransferase [Thermoanaerobaculales bacterium]
MPFASVVLVEPSMPGNLGAAMRIAANFRVPRLDLVRPAVQPTDPEVLNWACGAGEHLEIRVQDTFEAAVTDYRTLAATASGRGRDNLPVLTPAEAASHLRRRGLAEAALVFGNETRGLRRRHLDRADLVIRIPTSSTFPVVNLTQSVAILLGYFAIDVTPPPPSAPEPATVSEVDGLMDHLGASLSDIGFADPGNPERIQRKLRRLFGRAGITANEVKIIRGICRQMQWAAKNPPEIVANARPNRSLRDDD